MWPIGGPPQDRTEMKMSPASGSNSPEISIVVPVFRNKESLDELHRRLRRVLETERLPYEMIFVDDACPEGSLTVLKELAQADPQVALLALERNLGQQQAVLVGLSHARGKCVVVLDADLQDPPEAIPDLLAKLQEGPAAVFAGRRGRYESTFRLLASRLFKGLLHLLCGVPMDAGLFVAMNRQMVECLLTFHGLPPSVVAMIGCTGLPLTSIPVLRAHRPSGRSSYSFLTRLKVGCFAVAWVLLRKCGANRWISELYAREPQVKEYIGGRFPRHDKTS